MGSSMVGPQRKQRKPKVVHQSGTAYKMHFEERNREEFKTMSRIVPGQGTRKKPLLLTGKSIVNPGEDLLAKKTNKRIGFDAETIAEEKKEEKKEEKSE
jgi:hypothetical protein